MSSEGVCCFRGTISRVFGLCQWRRICVRRASSGEMAMKINGGNAVMSYSDGFIDGQADLLRLTDELKDVEIIAVDMESNGFFRYPEFICLIQIGFGGRQYLVDPVALGNIDSLLAIFADPKHLLLLHSCSYDVSSFKRDYDCEFGRLFDTATAAAFLGLTRLGLGGVLTETLGVDIPKSKKLQRCDWTHRPLSSEQVAYAKSDVQFLHELHSAQTARLNEQGRVDWVEEENGLAKLRAYKQPASPEQSYLKAKLVGGLSPRGKAIYRELFIYRDKAALGKGVPPFKVLDNDLMVKVSGYCAETGKNLDGSIRVPYAHIKGVEQAVEKGLAAEPITDGPKTHTALRLDPKQRMLLKRLKGWRAGIAAKLGLDPPLLWPTSHFEVLARRGAFTVEKNILNTPSVRKWQKEEFGSELLAFLKANLDSP